MRASSGSLRRRDDAPVRAKRSPFLERHFSESDDSGDDNNHINGPESRENDQGNNHHNFGLQQGLVDSDSPGSPGRQNATEDNGAKTLPSSGTNAVFDRWAEEATGEGSTLTAKPLVKHLRPTVGSTRKKKKTPTKFSQTPIASLDQQDQQKQAVVQSHEPGHSVQKVEALSALQETAPEAGTGTMKPSPEKAPPLPFWPTNHNYISSIPVSSLSSTPVVPVALESPPSSSPATSSAASPAPSSPCAPEITLSSLRSSLDYLIPSILAISSPSAPPSPSSRSKPTPATTAAQPSSSQPVSPSNSSVTTSKVAEFSPSPQPCSALKGHASFETPLSRASISTAPSSVSSNASSVSSSSSSQLRRHARQLRYPSIPRSGTVNNRSRLVHTPTSAQAPVMPSSTSHIRSTAKSTNGFSPAAFSYTASPSRVSPAPVTGRAATLSLYTPSQTTPKRSLQPSPTTPDSLQLANTPRTPQSQALQTPFTPQITRTPLAVTFSRQSVHSESPERSIKDYFHPQSSPESVHTNDDDSKSPEGTPTAASSDDLSVHKEQLSRMLEVIARATYTLMSWSWERG